MKRPTLSSFFPSSSFQTFFMFDDLVLYGSCILFPHVNIHNYLALIFMANFAHTHTLSTATLFVYVERTSAGQFTHSQLSHTHNGTMANMHKSHLNTQTKNPVRNYRIPLFAALLRSLFFMALHIFLLPCLAFLFSVFFPSFVSF